MPPEVKPAFVTPIRSSGGSKADKLGGDSAANTFDGGLGKDNLTGAGGKDKFVFSTALLPTNVDTITDFKHGQNKIVLDHAIFGALGVGKLLKSQFYAKDGAGALLFATLSGGPDLSFKDFAIV